jgi:hypothetical protein
MNKSISRTLVRIFQLSAAMALLLLLPLGASAQDRNLRVGIFGGGSFLKGERSFNVGGTPLITNYAKGGLLGVRVTTDLDSHWSLEGAYSRGTNNLRIYDMSALPPDMAGFGTRVNRLTGNVLYYAGEKNARIRPFVTAGIGIMRFSPTNAAKARATLGFVDAPATISANTKLAFNFGGGAEAKMNDWIGFRADIKDHIASIPRYGDPQAPTAGIADYYPVSGAVHNWEMSVGVVFYLPKY